MHQSRTPIAALAALLLGACGAPRTEADLSAAFARIQVEEARLEAATSPDAICAPDACATASAAADDLCAIAREIEDRDALLRCDRARLRAEACAAEPCGEQEGP